MATIQDYSECNPHLALWASENYVSPTERAWEAWVSKVEKKLGHSLDGNQTTDGYSLDYAYDYWRNGDAVDTYVADVRAAVTELDTAFGPVP